MTKLLQRHYVIVFNPFLDHTKKLKEEGATFHDQRLIFVNGDISRGYGLIIGLHEIGHMCDLDSKSDDDYYYALSTNNKYQQARISLSDQELATILKLERDAFGFALKKLRPFLGRDYFTEEAVLDLIHSFGLYRHSRKLEQRQS